MPSPAERMQILERLEKGEISPDEAARLLSQEEDAAPQNAAEPESSLGVLDQLERGEIDTDEAARRLQQTHGDQEEHEQVYKADMFDHKRFTPNRTLSWWLVPIVAGALITALSGLWMSNSLASGQVGLAFFCAWVPLALGVLLIVIGWALRNGSRLLVRRMNGKL